MQHKYIISSAALGDEIGGSYYAVPLNTFNNVKRGGRRYRAPCKFLLQLL